jgi:hypothetical protein
VRKSLATLSANVGRLDDLANPLTGWVIRPSFDVTIGSTVNTVQYTRLDLSGRGLPPAQPAVVLAARFAAGRTSPSATRFPAPETTR